MEVVVVLLELLILAVAVVAVLMLERLEVDLGVLESCLSRMRLNINN